MDETISIDLEKWEPVNFSPISESLLETLNTFTELYEEVMKPLAEMVKPILKAIQDIIRKIFDSIGSINISHITNQFYFTDFATIDVSNTETRRNQLPKKIIEEEPKLSLSYSVLYNSDNSLSDVSTDSSKSDCSENEITSVKKSFKQKIHDSLSFEFFTQTIVAAMLGWFFEFVKYMVTNNFDIQNSMVIFSY